MLRSSAASRLLFSPRRLILASVLASHWRQHIFRFAFYIGARLRRQLNSSESQHRREESRVPLRVFTGPRLTRTFCLLAEFPNANERGHRRCLDQRGMDAMNAGLNNFIASIRRRAGVSIKKNDK